MFTIDSKEKVTEECLGCICEAVSGCNMTRGCAEDDCGMFRITRLYWVDAGQPTLALDDPSTDGGKMLKALPHLFPVYTTRAKPSDCSVPCQKV